MVLISSIVAKMGNLGQMNYIAAKAGVVGLVRSGATELARFGTTVNGIRPGFIETPMTAAMPESAQAMMTANPLGRAGQPADIAGAVAFLCSDDAAFITGHLSTSTAAWTCSPARPTKVPAGPSDRAGPFAYAAAPPPIGRLAKDAPLTAAQRCVFGKSADWVCRGCGQLRTEPREASG